MAGSLRIFGPLVLSDGWASFAPFNATASFSCTFKFNSFGAPFGGSFVGNNLNGTPNPSGYPPMLAGMGTDAESLTFTWGPGLTYNFRTMQLGLSHFLAMNNNPTGVSSIWLDNVLVASGSFGSTPWGYNGAQIAIGIFSNAGACDVQIQDLGMSPSYVYTPTDVAALFNQTKTPIQIDPSFSYWSLAGPIGTQPNFGDAGLTDQNARGLSFVVTYLGALSNAVYAPPLAFVVPTVVTAQVTKSGGLTAFVATGAGDSLPRQILSVTQAPTINVQFGGVGATHAIQTWGPLADIPDPNGGDHTWAHFVMQNVCGGLQKVVIQNPGKNFTAPTVSAFGSGVAPTFGTPVLTGGVTDFSGIVDGGGHVNPPVVTISGDGWGAQADAVLTGPTVTSLNVFWPGHDYTTATATWSGGGSSRASPRSTTTSRNQARRSATTPGSASRTRTSTTAAGNAPSQSAALVDEQSCCSS